MGNNMSSTLYGDDNATMSGLMEDIDDMPYTGGETSVGFYRHDA